MIEEIKEIVSSYFNEIVKIRRHIHKHPELSFNEYKTSAYIKSVLTSWDIPFSENIADTGIVVLLEGNNCNLKIIAFRADFDALPILEENNIDYCSLNEGVMHACGHDVHTASLLGVIKVLNNLKDKWEGSVKFIFQPAEENFPGGAKQMIKEGVLDNPNVERIFAQHVFPDLEVGKVGFCKGQYMASADEIHVSIKGVGGHAALPHKYRNPIVAGAKLIIDLDEFFLPLKNKPSVFAIGFIKADGYTNVIPEALNLKGTFRAMNEEFRVNSHKNMLKIADKISKLYNVEIDFQIIKGYPSLFNDISLTENSINFAKQYMGEENVVELGTRMTAEDFSYFSYEVPSCFYRLGTANLSKGITHGLHTSRFNIDEDALKFGVGLMAYLAIKS